MIIRIAPLAELVVELGVVVVLLSDAFRNQADGGGGRLGPPHLGAVHEHVAHVFDQRREVDALADVDEPVASLGQCADRVERAQVHDDEELRHDPELHVGQGLVGHGKLRVVVRRCNRQLDVVQALLVDPRRVAARVAEKVVSSLDLAQLVLLKVLQPLHRENLRSGPVDGVKGPPLDRVRARLQVFEQHARARASLQVDGHAAFTFPCHRRL